MRLIDADACEPYFYEHLDDAGMAGALNAIAEMPTISAERRGKWEFIGGYGYQYRCSVCITCAEHKTRYCPNCGAKIERRADDE